MLIGSPCGRWEFIISVYLNGEECMRGGGMLIEESWSVKTKQHRWTKQRGKWMRNPASCNSVGHFIASLPLPFPCVRNIRYARKNHKCICVWTSRDSRRNHDHIKSSSNSAHHHSETLCSKEDIYSIGNNRQGKCASLRPSISTSMAIQCLPEGRHWKYVTIMSKIQRNQFVRLMKVFF